MDRPLHPWIAAGRDRIRFAVQTSPGADFAETLDFVQRAESLGFDAYWANDHPLREPDCWALLAALAARTERIRLLPLVNCVYYRSAAVTARQAADVDRISNGRVILGLGIGDDVEEFAALDIPMPPARQRQRRLEETVAVIRGLWSGEPFDFSGDQLSCSGAAMRRLPVQQPFVPLLLAGGGERVTLRQVAQYADMCNFGPHEWTGGSWDVDSVHHKLQVLQRHCADLGRPYEQILRSHYSPLLVLAETAPELERKTADIKPNPHEYFTPFYATPEAAIRYYQALAGAGMQYFLAVVRPGDLETVDLLAEQVAPQIRPA